MILYDDKHNFLGMSSHTLGFLGYEDVGEFLSMHNDFANLFVNKEGFIYNFENFNWIDFVLYSGAANKAAIITLKNGKQTQVDLSIKEVHLGHELNGIKKLYSVKLISDNFHEISGVPKAEESVGGVGGFSLSGLVEKDSKEEPVAQIQAEQNTFTSLTQDSTDQEPEKSDSFILNIADDTLSNKEDNQTFNTQESTTASIEDDFKLDFIKQEPEVEIPDTQNVDFLLKSDTAQEPLVEETILEEYDEEVVEDSTFLLKEPEIETKEAELDFSIKTDAPQEEEKTSGQFDFNLLKRDSAQEVQPLDLEPLALDEERVEEVTVNEPQIEVTKEIEQPKEELGFKLDFLKMSSDNDAEPEQTLTEPQSELPTYEERDNQEIIQQIKDDIKEIDDVTEDIVAQKVEEESSFVLDIPTEPQVEQPLEIEQNVQEKPSKEALSNFQIDENQSLEVNKSFTSTLKGLFGAKSNTVQEKDSSESDEENAAFSFHLKKSDNQEIKTPSEHQEEPLNSTPIKEESTLNENIVPETVTEEISLSSLSALGLSADDEFDLLNDFFYEAKESIETIEQFIQTKDFDKINYSLVKIKSSAEILNLDAIINSANSIREHCITENSEQVIQETQKLSENIRLLEKQLEVTAL